MPDLTNCIPSVRFLLLCLLPGLPLRPLPGGELERLLHEVPHREGPEESFPGDPPVPGDSLQDPAGEREAGETPPLRPPVICGPAAYQATYLLWLSLPLSLLF